MVPVLFQVTLRLSPTFQSSAPFGDVMVREPLTVKLLFEVSTVKASAASLARTLSVAPIASGTVQVKDPSFGVLEVMETVWLSSEKPLVEYSNLTFAKDPAVVHVMF